MGPTLLTHRAEVAFPPGLDRTELCVLDAEHHVVAETSWRPLNFGATWCGTPHLNALGWRRRTPWRPSETGFSAGVEPER